MTGTGRSIVDGRNTAALHQPAHPARLPGIRESNEMCRHFTRDPDYGSSRLPWARRRPRSPLSMNGPSGADSSCDAQLLILRFVSSSIATVLYMNRSNLLRVCLFAGCILQGPHAIAELKQGHLCSSPPQPSSNENSQAGPAYNFGIFSSKIYRIALKCWTIVKTER